MRSSYKKWGRRIQKKRIVLLIVLFTVSIVLCHAKDGVVYREFRYRIDRNSGKSSQSQPVVALPAKKTGIVLESRAVNIDNGAGRGGWQLEKRIMITDPNDRDLEAAYINSPRSWYWRGYIVTAVQTSDNRWYWWEKDGSLHFYAACKDRPD
jgi:hypothetical protein